MTRSAATDSPAADDAAVPKAGEVARPRSPVDEPTAPLMVTGESDVVAPVTVAETPVPVSENRITEWPPTFGVL